LEEAVQTVKATGQAPTRMVLIVGIGRGIQRARVAQNRLSHACVK
jgi:hypothetical protein